MTEGNVPDSTATADTLEGWSDAFEQLVSKGTRNAIDLPAFYDFSEERYRFMVNGSRITDPANTSTRFTDQEEQFLIEPEAGDTVVFKSAESPRYVVGSDAAVSWSLKFASPLVDETDLFTLFLGDAFEIEYAGDGSGELRALKNGTVQGSETFDPPNDLSDPSRPELTFNWYAVGRLELEIDYTADNSQRKSETVILTVDDDWLSGDPTGPVGFELDVTNGGVQLEAGSMAYIVQTDTPPTGRKKPHVFSSEELGTVPANGYGVLGALRVDPERDNIFTSLESVDIAAEASVDTEVFLFAVSAEQTDADFIDVRGDGSNAGPAYPRSNNPQNSVVQWTPNVSTFPTRTYAVTGNEIPNGRAVGAAVETSSGQGSQSSKSSQPFAKKRPLYPDDVVLIIGHTPDASTSTGVEIVIATDQDW